MCIEKEMKNYTDSIGTGTVDYIIDGKFIIHRIHDVSPLIIDEVIEEEDKVSSFETPSSSEFAASIKVDEELYAQIATEYIIAAKCRIINGSIAQLIAQLYDRLTTSYIEQPLKAKKRKVNETPFVRGVLTTGLNFEFFQLTKSYQRKPTVHHYGSLRLSVFRDSNIRNSGSSGQFRAVVYTEQVMNVLAAFVISVSQGDEKRFL